MVDPTGKEGYVLDFEDTFDSDVLDERWLPYYLPQWSSRAAAATRYRVGGGELRLLIEEDQRPWCPEFDGGNKTSTLQTGVYAGDLGSPFGQVHFRPDLVVREEQENKALYLAKYGFFELRAKAIDDPACMVALWMAGYEDVPERSAEILVCEIFGHEMTAETAAVGMGLRPFADPNIRDTFAAEPIDIDARDFHVYAAEWTPDQVSFYVDHKLVKTVDQSPDYPMQFWLGIFEFPDRPSDRPYPKEFVIDYFRAYRPA